MNHTMDHTCIDCKTIFDLRSEGYYCPNCGTSWQATKKGVDKMVYIGIDPGVKTGLAVIKNGLYFSIKTLPILRAVELVNFYINENGRDFVKVYIEDPNKRKYFGRTDRERLQGAGSIKRDFKIWMENFDEFSQLQVECLSPKQVGSLFDNVKVFKDATKWTNRTSKHARDAARMIYKHYKP